MKSAKNKNEIGKLLKYHRKQQKLSQNDLSKKTGLTQPVISNIENGTGGTLKSIELIMQALNLSLSFEVVKEIDKTNLLNYSLIAI